LDIKESENDVKLENTTEILDVDNYIKELENEIK